jgi:hypothetical protein
MVGVEMVMKFNLNINKIYAEENWVRDNLGSDANICIEKVSVNYDGLPRIEHIYRKKGDKWILTIGLHENKTLTLEVDDGIISEEDAIMLMLRYS